jgi:hypothetical protein
MYLTPKKLLTINSINTDLMNEKGIDWNTNAMMKVKYS